MTSSSRLYCTVAFRHTDIAASTVIDRLNGMPCALVKDMMMAFLFDAYDVLNDIAWRHHWRVVAKLCLQMARVSRLAPSSIMWQTQISPSHWRIYFRNTRRILNVLYVCMVGMAVEQPATELVGHGFSCYIQWSVGVYLYVYLYGHSDGGRVMSLWDFDCDLSYKQLERDKAECRRGPHMVSAIKHVDHPRFFRPKDSLLNRHWSIRNFVFSFRFILRTENKMKPFIYKSRDHNTCALFGLHNAILL